MLEKMQIFGLTGELKDKLDKTSHERKVSQGELCRIAVKKYLEEKHETTSMD